MDRKDRDRVFAARDSQRFRTPQEKLFNAGVNGRM